jgi:hypothetical protein
MKRAQTLQKGCPPVLVAICIEGCIHKGVIETLRRQSACGNHSGQAASRIGPSTETEQENFVAWFMQVRDLRISVFDLLIESQAKGSSHKLLDRRSIRSHTVVVEGYLAELTWRAW